LFLHQENGGERAVSITIPFRVPSAFKAVPARLSGSLSKLVGCFCSKVQP